MDDLKRHFIKLGSTLPAGQDLRIEVTDVDLAGRMEPTSRAAPDFRILRGGADWPIISLRFAVEANGQLIKRGDERIADMSYLQQINPYTASVGQYAINEQMPVLQGMCARAFARWYGHAPEPG